MPDSDNMSISDTDSDYHSMSEDDNMSDGDSPDFPPQAAFGPQAPHKEVVRPLGKEIRIRVDIDGCKGLPQYRPSSKDGRRSWYLMFSFISSRDSYACTDSSTVHEGKGIHRGTVQWNETIFIDCLELSPILIDLSCEGYGGISNACVSVEDLSRNAEIILWPDESVQSAIRSTLHLSASRVLDNRDKGTSKPDPAEAIQRKDHHNDPPTLWNTVFCQFAPFIMVLNRMLLETNMEMRNVYSIQWRTFDSFKHCQVRKSHDPKIDKLLTDMGATVNAVRQSPYAQAQHGNNVVKDIIKQTYWLTELMYWLAMLGTNPFSANYSETELARLVVIIGTPDPTVGASSTSASTNWHIISGTITKDALLLALEAIVQSADAFPPLKSAASGLLFFATCADMASGNKKQIRDIYRRVEGLAASLERGARDGDPLSPAHQEAIAALAHDITILNEDLQDIITERKNRFKRFFSAKRHREELKDVVNQLEVAKSNYTTALATLNATTNARVLAHVQAITLVMGVSPVEIFGTRRADAVEIPSALPRIEEV